VIQGLEDRAIQSPRAVSRPVSGLYPCRPTDRMDVTMSQQNSSACKVILKERENKSSLFYSKSYSCKDVGVVGHDKNLASRMPKEDRRDHSYHVLFTQDIAGFIIVRMRRRLHGLFRIWLFIYGPISRLVWGWIARVDPMGLH